MASQVLADNGVEYDKVLELIEELIAPGNAVAVSGGRIVPEERRMCLSIPSGGGAFPSEKVEQNTF